MTIANIVFVFSKNFKEANAVIFRSSCLRRQQDAEGILFSGRS